MNIVKSKFMIGISGHRNLDISHIKEYKNTLRSILSQLVKSHQDKEIIIVSPLADGADRLIVNVAQEMGLRYDVLLPMPLALYVDDFDDDSFEVFEQLFYKARDSKITEFCNTCDYELVSKEQKYRDLQYQKMGYNMVDTVDHMVYMWDGVHNGYIGGTSDVFKYAKLNNKKTYNIIECDRK